MFPYIEGKKGSKKHVPIVGTPQMIKQWEETKKQLQAKAKSSITKINSFALGDFIKICQLKQVPEFYSNYFIWHLSKCPQDQVNNILDRETRELLNNISCFHKINTILNERAGIIKEASEKLEITEGFQMMNSGEPISSGVRRKINQVLSDAKSLEDIKKVEKDYVQKLANQIIQLRNNLKDMMEAVFTWQTYLLSISDLSSLRKIKVIYPFSGINCLLVSLYDQYFLRKSFLSKYFIIPENNPFFTIKLPAKKKSVFQQYFQSEIIKDQLDYNQMTSNILNQIPMSKEEIQQKKQRQKQKEERQEKEKEKINKLKQIKAAKSKGKNKEVGKQKSKKIIDIDSLIQNKNKKSEAKSVQSIEQSPKKNKSITKIYKTNHNAKIQNIIFEKKKVQQQLTKAKRQNKEMKEKLDKSYDKEKIKEQNELPYGIKYKKSKNKLKNRSVNKSIERESLNQALNDKKILAAELQKQKLRNIKLLKKVQESDKKVSNKEQEKVALKQKYKDDIERMKLEMKNRQSSNQSSPKINKSKSVMDVYSPEKRSKKQQTIKESPFASKQKKNDDEMITEIKKLRKLNKSLQKNLQLSRSRTSIVGEQNLQNSRVLHNQQHQKKIIQKELKQQIREKNRLEKLLQKQTKQFEKQKSHHQRQKGHYNQEISLLKQKISQRQMDMPSKKQKNMKSGSQLYLQSVKKKKQDPLANLLEQKISKQKMEKRNLQIQIKELNKEKSKLMEVIQRSEGKMAKENERNEKKIQKYEKIIEKLKERKNASISEQKKSKLKQESSKKSSSLRMYTTTPMKNRQKKQSLKKQEKYAKSMNYFKLPPEVKKIKKQKQQVPPLVQIREQNEQDIKKKKIHNVEIIQTKKTIQIVYESNRRKRQKIETSNQPPKQEKDINKQQKEQLEKVKKEKEELLYKLDRQQTKKQLQQKARQRRMKKEDNQIKKYQQIIEKEREKKMELEKKMKELKKNMYQQFEERLKNQKLKFQSEKKELIARIENQKEQKLLKEKYLSNQVKFLREMENNENQLIKMLQIEKKNRKEKEKLLADEIAKKQELLALIQIEEIKKGIEQEIRKQLQEDNQSEEEDNDQYNEKKNRLQAQIRAMNEERNEELDQIDEQNQKLKKLIERIKEQQNTLISAIKNNMDENEDNLTQEQQISDIKSQKNNINDENRLTDEDRNWEKNQQQKQEVNLEQTKNIFVSRLMAQEEQEKRQKQSYRNISESPEYREKEQVENLIQMYLQQPNQKQSYSPKQKGQMANQILQKSKQAGDFQKQLMKLKNIQAFVPTQENDMMTSHLLNLKKAYQDKETSALRQELFPAINREQQYGEEELSFQSEQFIPKTLKDHVDLHQKKYPEKKPVGKNFLAINKMRVALLQENRKEKQKQMIAQEAKKRAQLNILKKNMKEADEQRKKQVQKKQMEKEKKQSKKEIKGIKKKVVKKREKQGDIASEKQKQKQKERVEEQFNQIKEQNQNEDRDENANDVDVDENVREQKQKSIKSRKEDDEESVKKETINTKEIDQMMNMNSELDRERQLLQSEIHSFQDEIRSYISGEQQFEVYQQFVDSDQIDGYIKQLLSISTDQIKLLNNNVTFSQDINSYRSVLILIAKDRQTGMEIGIGVFHKEFEEGCYVGDYIIAHNMRNFLNIIFNFSRYIFKLDKATNKIQFFFDLSKIEDELSIIRFIEFEDRCKRLGQVYIKVDSDKNRKYVLRRNLFQPSDREYESEGKGLYFKMSVRVHEDLIKERSYGFKNNKDLGYFSITTLIANFLQNNPDNLAIFRKNAQEDLRFRELLLTALMLNKKQISIKNIESSEMKGSEKVELMKKLHPIFNIEDPAHLVQKDEFLLEKQLALNSKRCTFKVEEDEINYIIHFPDDPITKIQSSNSSETGIFMSLIPKYKILLLEAGQFIQMNRVNNEVNVFFYIKHFIKNITDVRKESHPRVFIPEVNEQGQGYFKDLSEQTNTSIFGNEGLKIGWTNSFSNSIIFNPTHKDLVIRKPFIVALLSANIERAIQGTPICASVVC